MNYRQDLLTDIQELVKDVEKTHRYSMSRIYGLWNEAFGRKETPQSCASCLLRKVKELKGWMEQEVEKQAALLAAEQVEELARTANEETVEKPVKKRGRKKKGEN